MAKKILFVGLGSAGQRHLRNLLRFQKEKLEIIAYRYHKSERVFGDQMQVIEKETLASKYHIKEYENYEEALDTKPNMVFITNPNSLHIPYALKAAERGYDLFIEKPLSTTLTDTKKLANIVLNKKAICQIGFQQRYHPCLRAAKQYLNEKKLGKIIAVDAEVGERVSRMHSYEDYQSMPETQDSLGGGVVFCQSHEMDYIFWLFGEPSSVYSIGGKKSEFDFNVEDTATTILRYEDDIDEFAVILHQDFLQYPPVRKCKIIGTEGRIEIDLLGNQFLFQDYGTEIKEEKAFPDFVRNDMFAAELKDFFSCVDIRKVPECNIDAAISSIKMGMAIKESFTEKREVKIRECI